MCDCMALSAHARWMSQKKPFFCVLQTGDCVASFSRGEEKTYNFIHARGIPHIFPFGFERMKERWIRRYYGARNEAQCIILTCLGVFFFFFVWELNVCFTLYLCLECFRFASKKTNMLKLNGKRQRDNTGSESVSEAVWPWDEPLALCVAGPRENEEESRNNRRSSKAWNVRKSEGRGFRCELICVYVPEWTEGVGDVGVLRGLTGIPQ